MKREYYVNNCQYCGNRLNRLHLIWAVEGMLYCSRHCAVENHMIITDSHRVNALEWFNIYAEHVSTTDLGLR